MKRTLSIVICALAVALAAAAASLDGKWIAKLERSGGAKGTQTVEFTFDFKTEGSKLTGSVSGGAGRRPVTLTIENGKIEGDRFSFTTVQRSRKGDQKMVWEGTIAGDELKGTRTVEGRRRGVPFTARRAG